MAKAAAKTKMVETPANGRTARVARETKETAITADLNLDGEGRFTGTVGVPFFEHMMALFTRHALVDLELSGTGDTQVDAHHTVEDCGIVLGQAIRRAAGDKRGIARYGMAYVPMEETLARCVLDLCDRPFLRFDAELPKAKIGDFDAELGEEFLRALAFNAGLTMYITVFYGSNLHHILEAVFKAVGLALGQAVAPNPRVRGVLSTKGVL
jgi:imidazoleglycerol-phosphate dehydratase